MSVILETKNISKIYGKQKAVDQVNLSINQGDIYGLIGRNGAGKTTLMKMMSGLAKPSEGSFTIFGKDPKEREASTRISSLIESTGIYPDFTAYDHLLLKAKAIGLIDKKEIEHILSLVGLDGSKRKPVKKFSLGMKQRLGIGLALLGRPDIVILDEPINGLDPQGIVEVRKLIEKLNREEGLTFIISSHILEELSKLSNRFGIIDHGVLLEELTREELELKGRDRIELKTSKIKEASILLDELNMKDYLILDESILHIYSGLTRIAELVLALADRNIPIEGFMVHKGSLEDYYLSLTK